MEEFRMIHFVIVPLLSMPFKNDTPKRKILRVTNLLFI